MSLGLSLAIVVAISYLIGSIPFGFIAVRVFRGLDIRKMGSKNVGATNVLRVAGKRLGFGVLAADTLKGVVAVVVAGGLLGTTMVGPEASEGTRVALRLTAGAGAILGHVFTLFLHFKGGKGVATGLGVLLSLAPVAALSALGSFVVVVAMSRYVSLGSIVAAVVLVLGVIFYGSDPFGTGLAVTLFGMAVAVLVILRHVSNIRRLLAGKENKISFSKKAPKVPLGK